MLGEAEAEELVEDGGACAEQPRQIIRKTRNARRTIMNRSHLYMRKSFDYLTPSSVATDERGFWIKHFLRATS
jgi:hypothetical protein